MICAGMSTREISTTLFVGRGHRYGHVKHMMRKLGVKSRAEAGQVAGCCARSPTGTDRAAAHGEPHRGPAR